MKNILIAATIVGAVAAGVIIYLRDNYSTPELEDAGEDAGNTAALNTMNKHIREIERKTNPVLN